MRFLSAFFSVALVCAYVFSAHAEVAEVPCSRVDLRSRSKEVGWPRAPHQGGRPSGATLAAAEAISMKLAKAVTPLDLDRAVAAGEAIEAAIDRISAVGFCPLDQGPMDDVAFSRDPIKVPSTGCDKHPERRFLPEKITLVSIEPNKIDVALDAKSPVLITWEIDTAKVETLIVGRRFNTDKQRCEWQVRNMGGPFCRTEDCEDGASWIARADAALKSPRVMR